jgi:hypothetical protein
MLNVAKKVFMLDVIMQSVFMISVVVPVQLVEQSFKDCKLAGSNPTAAGNRRKLRKDRNQPSMNESFIRM